MYSNLASGKKQGGLATAVQCHSASGFPPYRRILSGVIPLNSMQRMTYTLRLCLALALGVLLSPKAMFAQDRLIVVNGGLYEFSPPFTDYVTVGYLDPTRRRQVLVDTLPAQSVVDALVAGDTLFVVTDYIVRSYRLPAFQEIASSRTISGLRKAIKVGNRLFTSRGFGVPTGGSYLLQLNASTLAVEDSVSGIPGEAEHMLYTGGKLFLGVPGPFGTDTGTVLTIDPATKRISGIYRLDTLGKGVSKIISHNGSVYTIATRGYGAPKGGLARLDPNGTVVIRELPYSVGYSSVGYATGKLYGAFGGNGLALANTYLNGLLPTPVFRRASAAVGYDTRQDRYIVTSADYTSPGKAFLINGATGAVTDSIAIGIAAEAVAFWQDRTTAVSEPSLSASYKVYPNPAHTELRLDALVEAGYTHFHVLDMQGRQYPARIENSRLDVSLLPAGMYLLRAETGQGVTISVRFSCIH